MWLFWHTPILIAPIQMDVSCRVQFGDSPLKVKVASHAKQSAGAEVSARGMGVMGSKTKYNNRSFRKPKKLYNNIFPNLEGSLVRFIRINQICVKRTTFRKIFFYALPLDVINVIYRQFTNSSLFHVFSDKICFFQLAIRLGFALG